MTIIEQLGINGTAFIQFFVFIFSFVMFSQWIFKDFNIALQKRELNTKGSEEITQESQQKYQARYSDYENKTRDLQQKIQKIFEDMRLKASEEAEKLISQARIEAQISRDQIKSQVGQDLKKAQTQIAQETPMVSNEIIKKLLPNGRGL